MDDSSIVGRTEMLRREIEVIQQAERNYRGHKNHTFADRAEHEKRESRILMIREELRTFIERAKQRSSHGSVWYS